MSKVSLVLAVPLLVIARLGSVHSEDVLDGQALLKKNCGRCHAVQAQAKSPIGPAPNLWEKLRTYPSERLQVELAEGVGSRHPAMPQIQFSDEDIAAIQGYLASERR